MFHISSSETGLLRSAFEDFVLEFNAKCLIFNKFRNPEPAKALSWVVDKKDARITISNRGIPEPRKIDFIFCAKRIVTRYTQF